MASTTISTDTSKLPYTFLCITYGDPHRGRGYMGCIIVITPCHLHYMRTQKVYGMRGYYTMVVWVPWFDIQKIGVN